MGENSAVLLLAHPRGLSIFAHRVTVDPMAPSGRLPTSNRSNTASEAPIAKLWDPYKHWGEDDGLVEVGHLTMRDVNGAVIRSLATMEHALSQYEATAELLGPRAG